MTTNKYTWNTGDFHCHADVAVQCGAHHPMEHIPASLEATGCSNWVNVCITLPQRPLNDFGQKHRTLTKNCFSKLTYGRPKPKVVRISYPKSDPLLSSLIRQSSFKCEMPRLELKSLRTFLAIKNVISGQKIRSGSVLDGSALDGFTRDVGSGCRDGSVGTGWLGRIGTAWRTYKIVQIGCLV